MFCLKPICTVVTVHFHNDTSSTRGHQLAFLLPVGLDIWGPGARPMEPRGRTPDCSEDCCGNYLYLRFGPFVWISPSPIFNLFCVWHISFPFCFVTEVSQFLNLPGSWEAWVRSCFGRVLVKFWYAYSLGHSLDARQISLHFLNRVRRLIPISVKSGRCIDKTDLTYSL